VVINPLHYDHDTWPLILSIRSMPHGKNKCLTEENNLETTLAKNPQASTNFPPYEHKMALLLESLHSKIGFLP